MCQEKYHLTQKEYWVFPMSSIKEMTNTALKIPKIRLMRKTL